MGFFSPPPPKKWSTKQNCTARIQVQGCTPILTCDWTGTRLCNWDANVMSRFKCKSPLQASSTPTWRIEKKKNHNNCPGYSLYLIHLGREWHCESQVPNFRLYWAQRQACWECSVKHLPRKDKLMNMYTCNYSTYLAYAFSIKALQNSFFSVEWTYTNLPPIVGKRSSMTTSVHWPWRKNRNLKIPW